MENSEYYRPTTKMFSLICQQPSLLQMMSRFGIPLGVEDKTVDEICSEHDVDTTTFLAVANYIRFGREAVRGSIGKVSIPCLMDYLRRAHRYFLDFQLPSIRRELLEAIICTNKSELSKIVNLIIQFYDSFTEQVRRHMEHEDSQVFIYVDELLEGNRRAEYSIDSFARSHEAIDSKLQEVKNVIIKYYKPDAASDLLNAMMYDIFVCEKDLRNHCEVENDIFVPAVKLLEDSIEVTEDNDDTGSQTELSDREKEIVGLLVRGMKNKEIADKLFISVHTVQTHRKNISRKLDIHSVGALSIYAIVNNIVNLEDIKN